MHNSCDAINANKLRVETINYSSHYVIWALLEGPLKGHHKGIPLFRALYKGRHKALEPRKEDILDPLVRIGNM